MNLGFIYGWILIIVNAAALIASFAEKNPTLTTVFLLGALASCEAQRLRYRRVRSEHDFS
jgi:hypothetical protein